MVSTHPYVMGVDPGSSKAGYAFYSIDDYVAFDNMDTATRRDHVLLYKPKICVMEKVGAMRGNAAGASSAFLRSVGVWEGILGTLDIPLIEIPPKTWAKSVGLQLPACLGIKPATKKARHKKAKLEGARRRFPKAELHLAKHIDRAEALYMALCAHNLHFGKSL